MTKSASTPEVLKFINEIFVFDADGVITALESRTVEQKKIIDFIVKILQKNEPVAINTGSAISWVRNKLLSPIYELIPIRENLKNLFISAEKGGFLIKFDEHGQEILIVDNSINISDVIKNIKELESKAVEELEPVIYREH